MVGEFGDGAHYVVGFVSVLAEERDVHCLGKFFDHRECGYYFFGAFIARYFVYFVEFVAEGSA